MNKRKLTALALVGGLLAATLAPYGSGSAVAADPPIEIRFDGETLVSDAEPFIKNGTTFVPFRALFERLGLEVGWDPATRTVTGQGGGVTMTLRVGNAEAIVNGDAKPLLEPPAIVGGRTFVPLRFVSENAGADVAWNGAERLIAIVTGPSIAEREAAVRAAYEAYVAAANREDASAVLRALHAQSPLRTTLYKSAADAFARRDVETTVESLVVEELHGGQATVLVTESNRRTAGAYYVDNRVDLKVSMRQDASGAWAIYDAATLGQEWLQPFGADTGADVDAADETIARNTIASYMEALNREDLTAALRLVHADSPMRSATEKTLAWMFETYELTHELENVRVLERSGDEMYVHTVQAMRKSAGPKLADVRTRSIHTLRLANGQWKLYATIQGKAEALSIPQ
ncbi:copper amine oxidase N-terminal domain-containing protein [Paenibacillus antri]|nr:copper amine oxidase N-terminal domain-containing protein [Paenibacillus antri]